MSESEVTTSNKVREAVSESRDLQADNVQRFAQYHPVETHDAVVADDGKQITVHAVAGQVFLNTHGERVLDREALITLRKKLDEAFMTVA